MDSNIDIKASIGKCDIGGHRGYISYDKEGKPMAAYIPTNESDFGLIIVATYIEGAEGVEIGINDGIVPYRTVLQIANAHQCYAIANHYRVSVESGVNWWVEHGAWQEAAKMVRESRDLTKFLKGLEGNHGDWDEK